MQNNRERIAILDFGSQTTQLIARRIRELNVYCEIYPYDVDPSVVIRQDIVGIVLSGGPSSVHDTDAPVPLIDILDSGRPVLGICYGCQLMGHVAKGKVERSLKREYGPADLETTDGVGIFASFDPEESIQVWMSHGDHIEELPEGFHVTAQTGSIPFAAIADPIRHLYGVQFHPEVMHTNLGSEMLGNFVYNICGCKPEWTVDRFVEEAERDIQNTVKEGLVICGLSGGVDSAVVSVLLDRCIGQQLRSVFIDNGLLRAGEAAAVIQFFKPLLGDRFVFVDAADRFLNKLKGITDPEEKRVIIGHEFISVFEEVSSQLGGVKYLAQGTLYPDVIESVSVKGPSATIKTHHNVGGLPERMNLDLIEPLRDLFKDEVREVGLALGLAEEIVWRQPFPGPGLGVRILGEVTAAKVLILQQADRIVRRELSAAGLMRKIWQAFAVLLPVKTVGVMGDERTYDHVCAVRAVDSSDAMTADWSRIPPEVLAKISSRIINEVKGINRVVYDISSKPPATIEWE